MPFATRAQLLASELQRFGMTKPVAASLSSEVMFRHPMVHRLGVPNLVQKLVRLGVDAEEATQLALTLWGFERLSLGACFQDLLDALRRSGVEHARAFPACVEARRLWLALSDPKTPADLDLFLARWCVVALVAMIGIQLLLGLAG